MVVGHVPASGLGRGNLWRGGGGGGYCDEGGWGWGCMAMRVGGQRGRLSVGRNEA